MIPHRKPSTLMSVCLFAAALAITFDRSAGMAATIDAALNVMGYDREVAISINGHPLSKITGGQSQSVRLFVAADPRIKTFPPEMQERMQELFCLQEGENSIEISFKQTGKPASPSRFTVTLEADGYQVPVLEYARDPEIKEGHAKGVFTIYSKAPAGFTTVVLK